MASSGTAQEPLLRLTPHPVSSLPYHEALRNSTSNNATSSDQQSQQPSNPPLIPFLHQLLTEAVTFADDYIPQNFQVKNASKSSPPATAKVELLTHNRSSPSAASSSSSSSSSAGIIGTETWFGRRSRHANERKSGSAVFAEFDGGLRQDHSLHEKDYTPSVIDARKVCEWDAGEIRQAIAATANGSNNQSDNYNNNTNTEITTSSPHQSLLDGFSDINLSVYEMCHKIPPPLQPRVFAVAVATARTSDPAESFVDVQIPIELKDIPQAFYSNQRFKREKKGAAGNDDGPQVSDVVIGIYTSVERCRVLDGGKTVEWVMATASDAGGVLPMWMQKLGTPGAVVKDVGLFMKWVDEQRK